MDFFLEFEEFDAGGEFFADAFEAFGDVDFLEEGLFFLEVAGEVCGEEVGEHSGLVDVGDDLGGFVGDVGGEFDHAFSGLADGFDEEVELGGLDGLDVGEDFDFSAEVGFGFDDFEDAETDEAVGENVGGTVGTVGPF